MYITRQNVKIAPYEGVRISLHKAFNGSGADVFGNEIIEKTIPVTTVAYRTVGVGDPADYNAQFTQSGSQAIDIIDNAARCRDFNGTAWGHECGLHVDHHRGCLGGFEMIKYVKTPSTSKDPINDFLANFYIMHGVNPI
jgi:hypothetical protein